ncbi:hypothetical protein GF406_09965 [candidate division KSB1 bacterium]|nr:hypothetical protein [candidate division KSB1 bacterium]
MLSFPEMFIMLIFFVFGVMGTVLWIWALVDCIKNVKNPNDRLMWIILIALTHFIGAILYFVLQRPKNR